MLGAEGSSDFYGLSAVIVALGAIVGAFIKYVRDKDIRAETTIVAIVDKHGSALDKHTAALDRMNTESAERSQSVIDCMKANSDTVKEAKQTIEETNRIIKEYKAQQVARAGT
jgi:hypothetical protein